MEKANNFRHEFKYRCDIRDIEIVKNRIKHLLQVDPHTKDGTYEIRSMYFDNCFNRCYFENEMGTDSREKFRIRIYNGSSENIFLECKRKEHGKTHKTSARLTLEQFNNILNNQSLHISEDQPALLNKFICLIKTQMYRPAVIVGYERIPYIYKCGNVRVTVDMNIRASRCFDKFFEKDIPWQPILPKGEHLVEVKYDELLPDFIKNNLEMIGLRRTTFSKYYLCRRFSAGGLLI